MWEETATHGFATTSPHVWCARARVRVSAADVVALADSSFIDGAWKAPRLAATWKPEYTLDYTFKYLHAYL